MKEIQDLIQISQFYGKNKSFVIAGGGNTSYKNDQYLWVKASGTTLGAITEDGFAVLDRSRLNLISTKQYSNNSDQREQEVKTDLLRASAYPEKLLRPSVETSMHNFINYRFVVHTHPTVINALLCSQQSAQKVQELFGDEAVFIPYTDPGYVLSKKVETELTAYRAKSGKEPHIILLQNHGIFVSADTVEEVKAIYESVTSKISAFLPELKIEALPVDDKAAFILPAIRMMLSDGPSAKVAVIRNDSLIASFTASAEAAAGAAGPFTPDIIVYCKARPIYLEKTETAEEAVAEFQAKLDDYRKNYGYDPKIVLAKGLGLIAVEDNMNDREISFIDNWEVENYRRKVSKGAGGSSRVNQKIAVVTGGAQGFGGGLAERLFDLGANVVIADMNEVTGQAMEERLNAKAGKNRALFVKVNVSDPASVEALTIATVKAFGGIDLFISNAGVLRAGGLDAMTPETFNFMTQVNYVGYFLCAKYASAIMKLQSQYKDGYFTDIIQINSKSGLKGSNKNFAYAGGKFGGIGLTQSFAMELMPFRIKVNSICPGNFYDGPLWSDPEKGLFVQYLKAGKVPGAKTVQEVKDYYVAQVPAKRGCEVEDVLRAVLYAVEQVYETGQAIPVTGGQTMLN